MTPSPWVRRERWQGMVRVFGPTAPATRAAFGRYVGSLGGTLSAVSAGREAWVAHHRQKGLDGFSNRAWRRALHGYLARGATPSGLLLFGPT